MALTKEAITQVRSLLDETNNTYNSVKETMESVKSSLAANEEYQKYIGGTTNGQTANEKYQKAIDIVNGSLNESISELSKRTTTFLTQQETLNNKAIY